MVIGIIIVASIYYIFVIREQQKIFSDINQQGLFITEDLKIDSIISKGIIDRGKNYNYCKFVINQDGTISLFFRNTLPKDIYYGPFIIKHDNKSSFKDMTYYISQFTLNNNGQVYISIETKPSIFSSYIVYINGMSKEDFVKLKKMVTPQG